MGPLGSAVARPKGIGMLCSIPGARRPSESSEGERAVRGANSRLAEEMLLSIPGASVHRRSRVAMILPP